MNVRIGRNGGLANPTTTKAQNQGCDLAHTNIYLIYDLLDYMKGQARKSKASGAP